MKPNVLSLLGVVALGGASCTTLVRTDPDPAPPVTTTAPGEHLFGHGGQRSTVSQTETTVRDTPPAPNVDVTADRPDSSVTDTSTSVDTSASASTSTSSTSTSGSGSSGSSSSASSSSGGQYALPHPTNPDLVLNPYDPSQEIRIRNLSGGKPDFSSGQRFAVPGQADQVIIVP